jgi:hypothetical protein
MTDKRQNAAGDYADAIELERTAWHALQAHPPGSQRRTEAWAAWSEAISRTNRAWRELSCQTWSTPRHGAEPSAGVFAAQRLGTGPRMPAP